MSNLKEEIIENLREVYDPELPINVYDLGLIYEVKEINGDVHVLMSLTSPTCPTSEYIRSMVEEAAATVDGVKSVDVEITFDPPWTPERVSEEAREELGLVQTPLPGNPELKQVFNSTNEPIKQNICFNCGVSDKEIPIFKCFFKGEETQICSKCIPKFA